MRYKLTLEYDGSGFVGWQRQSNGLSVQEVIETAVERFCGEAVRVFGAGRTDAGVHARGQCAHLDLANDPAPDVVRDALDVNGVSFGFSAAARSNSALLRVRVLAARAKVLVDLVPAIGAQEAELYGRLCYRPAATLNHLARGEVPSVARPALQRAHEDQNRLFRAITGASALHLPDVGTLHQPPQHQNATRTWHSQAHRARSGFAF